MPRNRLARRLLAWMLQSNRLVRRRLYSVGQLVKELEALSRHKEEAATLWVRAWGLEEVLVDLVVHLNSHRQHKR